MKKVKNKWLIGFSILIIVLIMGTGGKYYMNKRTLEKEYQQGIELIQDYVTNYLVENYEGIEKIEWQGIGVEYRNSPILGPSLFGNYVDTDVRVFVSENNYFPMTFRLNDEVEYDDDLQKYVKLESLNPENTDISVDIGKENGIYEYSNNPETDVLKVSEKEKDEIERVKKSNLGSEDAKTIKNLRIHELTY